MRKLIAGIELRLLTLLPWIGIQVMLHESRMIYLSMSDYYTIGMKISYALLVAMLRTPRTSTTCNGKCSNLGGLLEGGGYAGGGGGWPN